MNTPDWIKNIATLLIALVAVGLIAGAGGYCLRRAQEDPYVALRTRRNSQDSPSEVSFSEVRNASATLQNLGHEVVAGLYTRYHAGTSHAPPSACQAIRALEDYREEFKGTAQEFVVVQSLLNAFKKQSLYNRWLDTYLQTLYERPTDPLVGRLATESVGASEAAGRQDDLFSGFTHVLGIPFDFQSKFQVEAAIHKLAPMSSKPSL